MSYLVNTVQLVEACHVKQVLARLYVTCKGSCVYEMARHFLEFGDTAGDSSVTNMFLTLNTPKKNSNSNLNNSI